MDRKMINALIAAIGEEKIERMEYSDSLIRFQLNSEFDCTQLPLDGKYECKTERNSIVVSPKKEKQPFSLKSVFRSALDVLTACFIPSISIIAGCGMVKVVSILLGTFGIVEQGSSTLAILNMIGSGALYFLPFFIAVNAAKKFEVSQYTAMALAAILLYPDFLKLGEIGSAVSFFGFGIRILDYSSQAIPLIFSVWLLSYVDRFAEKISPDIVKVFLQPMIDLLVVGPLMLAFIGPASAILGDAFMAMISYINNWGPVAVGLNSMLYPLMVMTGTHNVTIPLLLQMFASQGFDTIFLPSALATCFAVTGSTFAVSVFSKVKDMKNTAVSTAVSALCGVMEPALFGVHLQVKKTIPAIMLAGLAGGTFAGYVKISAPAFVTPSLITFPVLLGRCTSIPAALLVFPVTFAAAFVLTWLFTLKDLKGEKNGSGN